MRSTHREPGRVTTAANELHYRLLQSSVWQRAVTMSVLYGGLMFLFLGAGDDGPWWQALLIYGAGGVFYGAAMTAVMKVQQRRMFAGGDGQLLSGAERVQALRAAGTGRLPDAVRVRVAAIRLARFRLRRGNHTAAYIAVVAVLTVILLLRAVRYGDGWWLAVACSAVVGPWIVMSNHRQRRTARALLQAASTAEHSPSDLPISGCR